MNQAGTASPLTMEEQARLAFVQEVRGYWAHDLYSRLQSEYADAVADQPPSGVGAAVAALQDLPTHPWFGWIERNLQKMKWRQLMDVVDRHSDTLQAEAAELSGGSSRLELAPDLDPPEWYTRTDIHCQPGGVWAANRNALVYEMGAKILHLGRNDQLELHQLFAQVFPELEAGARVVDLGCGFGKSTRPLAVRWPSAEVIGVDLSAPVLRLGHRRANEAGLTIRFIQSEASEVFLEDASCAAVTGTMLLHELPEEVLVATLRKAARLLRPGGVLRFLEFARTGELFLDACLQEHAVRNNEPYLPLLMDYPVTDLLASAGLVDARWVPFDDRGSGLSDGYPARDDWHFPWSVLCAERPKEQNR